MTTAPGSRPKPKLAKVRWDKIAAARRKHLDKMSGEAYRLMHKAIRLSALLAQLAEELEKGVY